MIEGKCDSCEEQVDILIPIRILCETHGGTEMQLRHYCPDCFINVLGFVPQQEKKSNKGWVIAWWISGVSRYIVQLLEKNADIIFDRRDKDPKVRELIKAKIIRWKVKTK